MTFIGVTFGVFFVVCGWFFVATIIEFFRVHNRSIQTDWAPNNKEKARSILANDILSAKEHVYILSGSANEEIYDDNDVLSAFRTATGNDKIEIKILFFQKETSAKELRKLSAEKRNFEFIPSEFIPKTHFRIIDSKCVYMEKPHDDDIEGPREFRYIKNDPLAGHIFEEKFKKLLSTCRQ